MHKQLRSSDIVRCRACRWYVHDNIYSSSRRYGTEAKNLEAKKDTGTMSTIRGGKKWGSHRWSWGDLFTRWFLSSATGALGQILKGSSIFLPEMGERRKFETKASEKTKARKEYNDEERRDLHVTSQYVNLIWESQKVNFDQMKNYILLGCATVHNVHKRKNLKTVFLTE